MAIREVPLMLETNPFHPGAQRLVQSLRQRNMPILVAFAGALQNP